MFKLTRNISKRTFALGNRGKLIASDFINDRLYHPESGYFIKNDAQLGYLREPIDFINIFGFEDYSKILYERYPKNAWLTPSEIFKPWYGMIIANYISLSFDQLKKKHQNYKSMPLHIMEVGAGNGSSSSSILDYFKTYHPVKYRDMKLTIVEISPLMVARCRNELIKKHAFKVENGDITFESCSILDYNKKSQNITFIIFLEVLDNMPHDRIYLVSNSFKLTLGQRWRS